MLASLVVAAEPVDTMDSTTDASNTSMNSSQEDFFSLSAWWSGVKTIFRENVFSPDIFIPFILVFGSILIFAIRKALANRDMIDTESLSSSLSYASVLEEPEIRPSTDQYASYQSSDQSFSSQASSENLSMSSATDMQQQPFQQQQPSLAMNDQPQQQPQQQDPYSPSLQSLYQYINQARKVGASELIIQKQLIQAGWPRHVVNTALFSKPKSFHHESHDRISQAFSY